MPERFEPLGEKLRSPPRVAIAEEEPVASLEANAANDPSYRDAAVAEVARHMALLQLAAAEACERRCRRVVRALADEVLARELLLAPVDLERLIQTHLKRLRDAQPVAVIAGPGSQPATNGLPLRIDSSLAPGDVLFEVRDGLVDLRLPIRIESALEDGT